MRGRRRSIAAYSATMALWLGLLFSAKLVFWCPLAHAVVTDDVLLLLTVTNDGRHSEAAQKKLTERIQLADGKFAELSGLRPSERDCGEPVCLAKIAQAHHASILLSASIEQLDVRSRLVRVWLFDARTQVIRDQKGNCDLDQVEARLGELTWKLLTSHKQDGAQPAPAATQGIIPDPVESRAGPAAGLAIVVRQRSLTSAQLSVTRKRLGWTVAAISALSLISASVLTSQHHRETSGDCVYVVHAPDRMLAANQQPCSWDFSAPMAGLWTTTAVTAVGATLLFVLPWPGETVPRK